MSRNRSCPWRANVAGSTGIGLDSVYRDIAWPKIRMPSWEKIGGEIAPFSFRGK
jgi:hypothetical protein